MCQKCRCKECARKELEYRLEIDQIKRELEIIKRELQGKIRR